MEHPSLEPIDNLSKQQQAEIERCSESWPHSSHQWWQKRRLWFICVPPALCVISALLAAPHVLTIASERFCSSLGRSDDIDSADDDVVVLDASSDERLLRALQEVGTTMACDDGGGSDVSRRTCAFRNLCYNPAAGDFVLVRPDSVSGAGSDAAEPQRQPPPPPLPHATGEALADERSRGAARLSTVGEHAQHVLQLVDVDAASLLHAAAAGHVTFLNGAATFVLWRFKPDNLMHALHDDLLPLFRELRKLLATRLPMPRPLTRGERQQPQQWRFPFRLFFADDHDGPTEHDALYAAMSDQAPLTRTDLLRLAGITTATGVSSDGGSDGRGDDGPRLVCFEEAHAGFDRSTLWYQYGFDAPQGPLLPLSASVGDDLNEFVRYLSDTLLHGDEGEEPDVKESSAARVGSRRGGRGHVLLLCRRGNRLILNEDELAIGLARACACRVRVAAAETHSLAELVRLASGARALVGVHGALLALAAFAPRGAVLIELFPFGLRPERYTPYATLAAIAGQHYAAWRNTDPAATSGHADDRPAALGGLAHLPPDERRRIVDADEVPPHRCCSDPAWLYRIYQDTRVDVEEVARLLADVIAAGEPSPPTSLTSSILVEAAAAGNDCPPGVVPARPTAVACVINGSRAFATWQAPWNADSLGCRWHSGSAADGTYEILWQGLGERSDLGGGTRSFVVAGQRHDVVYAASDGRAPVGAWVRLKDGRAVGLWSRYATCQAG